MAHHPLSIHHVGIVVRDIATSAAWYARHFGLEHLSDYELPGARAAMIGRGGVRIELIQPDVADPIRPEQLDVATTLRSGGTHHLALAVADLNATLAALAAEGIEIAIAAGTVPDGSGDRFAFVRDNERMLVELVEQSRAH
jgi:catechol 2,3-dioxygenase-like lactoylglutathione lyase family enzyme